MSTNNNNRNKNLLKLAIDKNYIGNDETDENNTPNSLRAKTFAIPDMQHGGQTKQTEDGQSPSKCKIPFGANQAFQGN